MKVYAVQDKDGKFITNQNGRFLYTRKADAVRIRTQRDYWKKRENKDFVTELVIVEATIGEWKTAG